MKSGLLIFTMVAIFIIDVLVQTALARTVLPSNLRIEGDLTDTFVYEFTFSDEIYPVNPNHQIAIQVGMTRQAGTEWEFCRIMNIEDFDEWENKEKTISGQFEVSDCIDEIGIYKFRLVGGNNVRNDIDFESNYITLTFKGSPEGCRYDFSIGCVGTCGAEQSCGLVAPESCACLWQSTNQYLDRTLRENENSKIPGSISALCPEKNYCVSEDRNCVSRKWKNGWICANGLLDKCDSDDIGDKVTTSDGQEYECNGVDWDVVATGFTPYYNCESQGINYACTSPDNCRKNGEVKRGYLCPDTEGVDTCCYFEPFENCEKKNDCLSCASSVGCGWCEPSATCLKGSLDGDLKQECRYSDWKWYEEGCITKRKEGITSECGFYSRMFVPPGDVNGEEKYLDHLIISNDQEFEIHCHFYDVKQPEKLSKLNIYVEGENNNKYKLDEINIDPNNFINGNYYETNTKYHGSDFYRFPTGLYMLRAEMLDKDGNKVELKDYAGYGNLIRGPWSPPLGKFLPTYSAKEADESYIKCDTPSGTIDINNLPLKINCRFSESFLADTETISVYMIPFDNVEYGNLGGPILLTTFTPQSTVSFSVPIDAFKDLSFYVDAFYGLFFHVTKSSGDNKNADFYSKNYIHFTQPRDIDRAKCSASRGSVDTTNLRQRISVSCEIPEEVRPYSRVDSFLNKGLDFGPFNITKKIDPGSKIQYNFYGTPDDYYIGLMVFGKTGTWITSGWDDFIATRQTPSFLSSDVNCQFSPDLIYQGEVTQLVCTFSKNALKEIGFMTANILNDDYTWTFYGYTQTEFGYYTDAIKVDNPTVKLNWNGQDLNYKIKILFGRDSVYGVLPATSEDVMPIGKSQAIIKFYSKQGNLLDINVSTTVDIRDFDVNTDMTCTISPNSIDLNKQKKMNFICDFSKIGTYKLVIYVYNDQFEFYVTPRHGEEFPATKHVVYPWEITLPEGDYKVQIRLLDERENIVKKSEELSFRVVDSEPSQYKLKMLFVPILWKQDQKTFEQTIFTQLNYFIDRLPLSQCKDKVYAKIMDVVKDNCNEKECYDLSYMASFARQKGFRLEDFDYIVGVASEGKSWFFTEIIGESNGKNLFWFTFDLSPLSKDPNNPHPTIDLYPFVFSHEIGHSFGLADEYCSVEAGSTDIRCNKLTDINYLSTDQGCNPLSTTSKDPNYCCNLPEIGECKLEDYGVCCLGNKGLLNGQLVGRSIMSFGGAPEPREWCPTCIEWINKQPKLKC